MPSTSKLTPEQWAEAARLRAEGATYASIGKLFGLSTSTVHAHAYRHSWEGSSSPSRTSVRKRSFLGANMPTRRRLIRRLYKAIDTRLTLMEHRMQQQLAKLKTKNPKLPPVAEDERETRAIGTLIKNLDKVTEYAADLESAASGGPKSEDAAALFAEADRYRRELAERLAKFIPPAERGPQ